MPFEPDSSPFFFGQILSRARSFVDDMAQARTDAYEEQRRKEEEERRRREEALARIRAAADRIRESLPFDMPQQSEPQPFGGMVRPSEGGLGGIGGQFRRLGGLGQAVGRALEPGYELIGYQQNLAAGRGPTREQGRDFQQNLAWTQESFAPQSVQDLPVVGPSLGRTMTPVGVSSIALGGLGGWGVLGKSVAAEVGANLGSEYGPLASREAGLPDWVGSTVGGLAGGITPFALGPVARSQATKGFGRMAVREEGVVTLPAKPGRSAAAKTLEDAGAIPPIGNQGNLRAIAERQQTLREAGTIGRQAEKVPGYKPIAGVFQPRVNLDREVMVGYTARMSVEADVKTPLAAAQRPVLDAIKQAFGETDQVTLPTKFGTKATKAVFTNPPAYVGPADRWLANTFIDIVENPQDYVLTPAQKAAIAAWDNKNSTGLNLVRGQYGVDVIPYAPENPGAVYSPHININEDLGKQLDRSTASITKGQVGKERVHDTAAGRMETDKLFIPETDPQKLLVYHDNALAAAASNQAFKDAVPGMTRDAVVDAVHPGLRKAKEDAAKAVTSLRGRIDTAKRQAAKAAGSAQLSAKEIKRLETRLAPLKERADELLASGEYGPELSHLAGQIYEANLEVARLSRTAGAPSKVAALKAALVKAEQDWHELVRRYRTAGTGEYVQNENTYRWYPAERSRQIDEILEISSSQDVNRLIKMTEASRQTVLSGDLSPLFQQGQLNALRAPVTFVKTTGKMLRHFDSGLDDLARREPDLVGEYVRSRGRAMHQANPEFEVRQSIFARIPKVGGVLSDAELRMRNILTRYDYETWKVSRNMLIKWGADPTSASYEAANALSKSVPLLNSAERGVSVARSRLERIPITSVSFATSPALMMKDAASGFAKLAIGNTKALRGREQLAMVHLTYMAAGLSATAALSAAAFAKERGLSVEEAVKRSLTPGKREFLTVALPGGRNVGLGGPFRSFVVAVAPQYRKGEWVAPNPGRWAANKLSPAVRPAIDLIKDRDFLGKSIRGEGPMWNQALRAIEYMAEGMALPISLGQVAEAGRHAVNDQVPFDIKDTIEDFLSGVGGGNLTRPSEWEEFDEKIRKEDTQGRHFSELNEWEQEAAIAKYGKPRSNDAAVNRRRDEYETQKEVFRTNQEADDKLFAAGKLTPEAYRNAERSRRDELGAFAEGLYSDAPQYIPKNPTPLEEYFQLVGASKEANGGRPAYDAIDAAVAAKPAEWRAYVDDYFAHHEREGTATQKELWAAQEKIKGTGFWDMETGRTQYLRDHKDLRPVLEKWGYSQDLTRYMDAEDRAVAAMQANDEKNRYDPKAWREERKLIRAELASAGLALFGSGEDKPPSTTVERWFAEIERNTDPRNKRMVDWDKVDAWKLSLSDVEQDAIDNYEGRYLTATEREYKRDVKAIAKSGYWDLADKTASRYAARYGMDPATTNWDKLQERVRQQAIDRYLARGMGTFQAQLLADTLVDKQLRRPSDIISVQRKRMRTRDRELAVLLAKWGYWDPGQKDSARLARMA